MSPPDTLHLTSLADAFRDSPAPTIVLSAEDLVLFWNRAAEQTFGWTAEAAAGKPLPFVPREAEEEHRAMRNAALAGESFTGRHIRRRRKDGEFIDLSVSTAPVRNAGGEVVATVSVYADITDQKREEESRRSRQLAADHRIGELAGLTEQLARQENLLRLMIDSMPGLVAYVDPGYRYRLVNRAYEQWFNRPASEIQGKTMAEVLDEGWEVEVRPAMDRALAGAPLCYERTFQGNNEERTVRITYEPDRALDGQVRGVVVFLQDVTEQLRAVRALAESEERFRRMVEIAAEGIYMVNPEGITTFVNGRMAEMLGLEPHQMVGHSYAEFLHPEDRVRATAGFALRKRGDSSPREYRLVRADGSTVWIDFTATPMPDGKGGIAGVLAMCTDVTERKLADQQMRQTQKLESLGILAGGIAHDFNNLLVGILGNATLASETLPADSDAARMLRDIVSAGERAAQLTRQLLAYAGKDNRAKSAVDLNSLTRELIPLLRTSVPRLVEVELDLGESEMPVLGDAMQLQQVLMNLVINAAESIPGSCPGKVTIRAVRRALTPDDHRLAIMPLNSADGEYAAVAVEDTGTGMDLATQARIFDPFYTTKFAGRGLGLSAVLGIVRGHSGTITLESAPGKGSRFVLLLPLTQRSAVGAKSSVPAGRAAPGSGTILIVDDESLVRDMSRRVLEMQGYSTLFACDGSEAVEELKRHPEIRAVVLDLAMPRLGGDAAAVQMRELRPDLPLLLCSGYAEQDARQLIANGGVSAFLQKPFTARALLEKVAEMLSRSSGIT